MSNTLTEGGGPVEQPYIGVYSTSSEVEWECVLDDASLYPELYGAHVQNDGNIVAVGYKLEDSQALGHVLLVGPQGLVWEREYSDPLGIGANLLGIKNSETGGFLAYGYGFAQGDTLIEGLIISMDSLGCVYNGCNLLSTEVTKLSSSERISIVRSEVCITTSSRKGGVVILDGFGRVVHSAALFQGETCFDLSFLAQGHYILRTEMSVFHFSIQ